MLAGLAVYPVKSLGGVTLAEAPVEPWGLQHDRRWLVLDPDGNVVTARECHALLGLTATPAGDAAIVLSGRDGSTIHVAAPPGGDSLPLSLSRLASVRSAGRDADEWVSSQIGRRVRLGWLDDPRRRPVSEAHGGLPGDTLSGADAGPLLLATRASLRQLDDWLVEEAAARGEDRPAPLRMERFRPNAVVDDDLEPFVEDGWKQLRIGDVDFRVSELCDRCVMTTIDPVTLKGGKEPLRTLARRRQWDHKTWFGVRLVPLTTGTLHVGDRVVVGDP